jgi:glycosyltransferase involved in cell wall biosynthesis
MIGRLLRNKGVREYAMAAARLRQRFPSTRCLLVGWIDDNPDAISGEELEQWVRSGAVEFLGQLEDVRPAIAKASVYVLPSYREGTPRTVLEAMAMGRPIITTDAPGCRETVVAGENGYLVPVGSVDGLLAAMERFIDRPEQAVAMGARSRAIAERKYDVNKVNGIMLSEMGLLTRAAGEPAK